MLACATLDSVNRRVPTSPALLTVLAIATSMVVLRALPYLLYPQLAFDSDQAIVGLMAKHLTERRAFPLFFYGQTYMLAVESWVAAPFFVLGGPSITALRFSILAWNLVFIWLLIGILYRDSGLAPVWALLTVSLIALVPPSVATQLMAAQGGIVEPFVWVVVLWLLRRRPLWFGVVFAIAFRNREFTAYAIAALLLVEAIGGELDRVRVQEWFAAAVTFAVGWQGIEVLKPFADLTGPGTRGQLIGGFLGSQFTNLIERSDFDRGALVGRAERLTPAILQWFSGAEQIDTRLPAGPYPWAAWIVGAFLVLAISRLLYVVFRRGESEAGIAITARVRSRVRAVAFPFYLVAVGTIAIAAFIASKPVLTGYSRYVLLGLLIPVGLAAALAGLEHQRRWRLTLAAAAGAWIIFATSTHALVAIRYAEHPAPDFPRQIAERLVADGVSTAIGGYWHAYVISFIAREHVRVASSDFVRIQEYQDAFEGASNRVRLSDEPCPNGREAGDVFICRP